MLKRVKVPTAALTLVAFCNLAIAPTLARAQAAAPTAPPAPVVVQPPPPPPVSVQPLPQPAPGQPIYVAPPVAGIAPVGFRTTYELRPRWGLVFTGIPIFAASFLLTFMSGYIQGAYKAMIPIIGPLFYLSDREDSNTRAANAGLVLVTAIQTTGVVLFTLGLLLKKTVPVMERITVAPLVAPSGGGLAAAMRF